MQELCTNRLPSMACHDIADHGDAAVATKKRKRNCGATAVQPNSLPDGGNQITTYWETSSAADC